VSLSEAEGHWRAFLKSLLRLVSAVEMEISEDWIAGKRYVTMNAENENEDKSVNSNKKRIYRNNVA